MNKNVYTITQVTKYISNMFAQDFMLDSICVKGEVSNVKYHVSGHIYFTLKDDKTSLSGIMYKGKASGLKFPMKDGDSVIVTGRIGVYEASGRYQIYASEIIKAGIGDLYARYEELKHELEEMGMFDESYKKTIPKYVRRLGVVTAETGAAIQDILRISTRRNQHIEIVVFPAQVQGDCAKESIVKGICELDELCLDVIIVGRGGGSIEDLWAFNEEEVARAIFNANTPIISAVGHESDFTIADYVADLRASTPSAAAELAIFEYDMLIDKLCSYQDKIEFNVNNKLKDCKNILDSSYNKIKLLKPENLLNQYKIRIDEMYDKLTDRMINACETSNHRLEICANKLEGLSPVKKLSSGYSYIVDSSGTNIKSSKQISCGDSIDICLYEGKVKAEVVDIIE